MSYFCCKLNNWFTHSKSEILSQNITSCYIWFPHASNSVVFITKINATPIQIANVEKQCAHHIPATPAIELFWICTQKWDNNKSKSRIDRLKDIVGSWSQHFWLGNFGWRHRKCHISTTNILIKSSESYWHIVINISKYVKLLNLMRPNSL